MLSLHAKPKARRRHAGSYKPRLELLECRTLPTLTYIPVDFSVYHNLRFQDLQPCAHDLPEGDVVLGGVPFHIPVGGNNAWWGQNANGPFPRSIDIPVNISGVKEVDTLINTSYGQPAPTSYAALEFYGSNGAFYRKDLIGNEDVRDHFYAFWT